MRARVFDYLIINFKSVNVYISFRKYAIFMCGFFFFCTLHDEPLKIIDNAKKNV